MATQKTTRKATRSTNKNRNIKAALAEWEEKIREPSLASKSERKREFKTLSNYPVKPLYTPLDVAGTDYLKDIGFPGQPPFTRGYLPNGFRSVDFPHSFYAGYGTAESTNKRFHELMGRGATRFLTAFDLPTQIGLDPNDPKCKGEVGKVGVCLPSLADADRLCAGVDLNKIGMTFGVSNCVSAYSVALLVALAEKRGIDPANLPQLQHQNDPLKEYTGRGTHIFPVPMAIELATDVREYLLRNFHEKWPRQINTGLVCTTQLSWCGVGAAEELGFALAHFVAYIDSALRRGLKLEEFVPKMDWHATSDLDIFQEVAKFRAGRKMFSRLMKERYHCDDPKVQCLHSSAFISAQRMTAQQPLNNLARMTMGVLACILGGLEGIATPGYDEAIALPTEESTRIGNMVKFIILHECGFDGIIDPLGGSYYLERLTKQIEEEAQYWFDKIQDMGGAAASIEKGFHYQEELRGLYQERQEVASGERVVIGINKFHIDEEKAIDVFELAPQDEKRTNELLQKLKKERNSEKVKKALGELGKKAVRKTSDNNVNIMPAMLEAVKVYASVGEIYGTLRNVFGEFKPATRF
ncbi:MAG: methylmalonyl-CoA mutase family protein [Chloroflexota bacterium]